MLTFRRNARSTIGKSIDFAEPNLSFMVTDAVEDTIDLSVWFCGEAAPPGTPDDERWAAGRCLNLSVSHNALLQAANEWALAIQDFPFATLCSEAGVVDESPLRFRQLR